MKQEIVKPTLAHATALAIQAAFVAGQPAGPMPLVNVRKDGSATVMMGLKFLRVYYNRDNVNEVVLFDAPDENVTPLAVLTVTFADVMSEIAIEYVAKLLA